MLNTGAYDLPEYEWGTASSPIIYKDLVIVQCDTQNESFVLAPTSRPGGPCGRPRARSCRRGARRRCIRRAAAARAELVTNASNFIRGYDPDTGAERWRLGGSSKITAPTPIFSDGPRRRRQRPRARAADLRHPARREAATSRPAADQTTSAPVAWSKTGRGSYMPTPLIYRRHLYVLGNAGLFDAYDLATGAEVYRQRLPHQRQRLQRLAGRGGRADLPVERGRRHVRRPRAARSSSWWRRTRWASR